jgi:hypothetical protein
VGEDVEEELADVGVDPPARLDRGDDRREVVVDEDHRRRLAGDVGPRATHRDADVGRAQRRRVVDAVAGHRDDVALLLQGVGDPQLRLGRAAGEDQLPPPVQEDAEILVAHPRELLAADRRRLLAAADADLAGDRRRARKTRLRACSGGTPTSM